MSKHASNVWIEIEEVEVVDGCDMFYEDRTDHLGYGKAGRFENLDKAVTFGQHLSRLAADDLRDGGDSLADRALVGLTASTRNCSWGNAHRSGRPRPR
jgi:hypothetical protein